MLDKIKEFLKSQKWESVNDNKWKKTITMRSSQVMVINGQRIEQPEEKVDVIINYLGEGEMWDAGEEKIPLYGFKIVNKSDIWVDGIEDFKFWYQKFFNM